MKVISLSTDKKILEEGSAVRDRMIEYGKLFDELHIVLLTTGKGRVSPIKLSDRVYVYKTDSVNKIFQIWDSYKISKKIIGLLGKNNPIIITTQDPFETGIVGVILKIITGKSLQIQLHTDFLNKYFIFSSFLNSIRFVIGQLTIPYANSVRVVSDSIKDKLIEINPNIDVLPIYTEKNGSENSNTPNKFFDTTILTISRLEKEKDIETIIYSFKNISSEYPNSGLLIVGDGSKRMELEKLVSKLNMAHRVKFLGWVNQVDQIYKNADIYVSTSLFEGYGMSIVEAAQNGLPLIISNTGVADFFENEVSAFICEPKDIFCFTTALGELLNDENKRKTLGENAKAAIEARVISKEKYLSAYYENIKKSIQDFDSKNIMERFIDYKLSLFRGNRILRFLVAGITAASTQILILYMLTDIFGIWYLLSSIISFIIAVIISFILQKLWAFRNRDTSNIHTQLIKYILVGLFGVFLNSISMYFLVDIIHIWYILAQIFAGVFIAVFNFFFYKKYIFISK